MVASPALRPISNPSASPAAGTEIFTASARRVVDYLNAHTPVGDWSVSRVAHGEQVHLHVHHESLIEPGDRIAWDATFCRRMVGGGARVVRDSTTDPTYADLDLAAEVRSYVGFPILEDDGSLFGVLCGVNADPLGDDTEVDAGLVELMSHLLSDQLALARVADRNEQAARLAGDLAETDALTGLTNRRGWDSLIEHAQQTVDAFGDGVSVAVLDLDEFKAVNDGDGHDAGDAVLQTAARALRQAAGPHDRVARFGGDEFTVLSPVGPEEMSAHFAAYHQALADHGIAASIGYAYGGAGASLLETFRTADHAMYRAKQSARH